MKFLIATLILFLSAPAAAQDQTLPRLQVNGNTLQTVDGTPVTLRGVSLCSLDWHKPHDLMRKISTGPEAWKANVLRLPVQPKEWRKKEPIKYLRQNIDPAVKLCKENGLYCIIDWHEINDWTKPEVARELEEFWKIVAIRYAGTPNILYEVFNEPTEPKKRDAANWALWRTQMQKWVDMIRKDAPDTVLLIGSPHWSQMPSFAVDAPLEGKNLAYVVHVYPNYKPKQWDALFGDAAEHIPIFMTEWGWTDDKDAFWVIRGNQETFGQPLKDYLDARPQISWTAWSYDPKCGPAMLGKDTDMGAFVKDWLAESN